MDLCKLLCQDFRILCRAAKGSQKVCLDELHAHPLDLFPIDLDGRGMDFFIFLQHVVFRDGIVGEDEINDAAAHMVDQGFQVVAHGIAAGLSRLGHDVTYIEYGCAALPDGLQDLWDEKVRQDARIKAARS